MTDNPWLSQPDTTPYAKDGVDGHPCIRVEAYEAMLRRVRSLEENAREYEQEAQCALAEAERRGAERGWDQGWLWGVSDAHSDDPVTINPYRSQAPSKAATAPPEPVQPPGDHRDTTEPTGGAQ